MHLGTIAVAALLAALPAAAASPPVAPAGLAAAAATPGRPADMVALDASRKPVALLAFLGIRTGDRVLDVMGGQGYFAEIAAAAVGPKGAVLVIEPPAYLDDAKVKAGWDALIKRHPNVSLQATPPGAATLPAAGFDLVLMHLTYHDTYWESEKYKYPRMDPAAFLKKIYAATRPGGTVGVVDHVADPGGDTRAVADKLHRIDPAVIKADFKAAGFVLEAESPIYRIPADDHKTMVFDPAVRGKTDRVAFRFRRP